MTVASFDAATAVPRAKDRRRAKWLYDRTWGRTRRGRPRPLPEGTRRAAAATPVGPLPVHHLPGKEGNGTVVLAHPDRRYGGHWFVKEGWIDALQDRGLGVVWFDQPGYGTGEAGSPFLYENVLAATRLARTLDRGPVRVVGISLGAFAAACAAPHMPWVDAMVLESPYPSFSDWYEGRGISQDRLALGTWSVLFRRSMPAVDGLAKFHASPVPSLVAWSRNDDTTPPELSARMAEGRVAPTWTYEGEAEHLHLWQEPAYRDRVLSFLAKPPTTQAAQATPLAAAP